MREGVIFRVAALDGSAYEPMQHLGEASKVGWSDGEILEIEAGGCAGRLRADHGVRERMCSESGRTPNDLYWSQGRALGPRYRYGNSMIGHSMMVARFTGVLEIELDAKPDSQLDLGAQSA